jgi:signal transduction histidine kinase
MPLVGRPLAEALAALGRRFTSETGIRVHVRAPADGSFPLRVEAELLRIAQEALANVRKHARAGVVEIRLSHVRGRLALSIRDDGQGFRVRRAPGSGVGILGMQERARVLGGGLRVTSRPGHGTTVRASIPLGTRAGG